MIRFSWLLLALSVMTCYRCGVVEGQSPTNLRNGPLNDELKMQGARIDEQRVQRQSEVVRLEQIIKAFELCVTRLERQLLSMSHLPAITMAEAKAGVRFADAQLTETNELFEKGEVSKVQVAAAELAVARAQGQMDAANAAHADSLIRLELGVLDAQHSLLEQSRERTQMERFVARGFTTSEGLRLRVLDEGVAEKRLELAKLRLETVRKSAGVVAPADVKPPAVKSE